MSDELNPVEERSLDVLLSEVHGASGPRDFTREIVGHLNDPLPEFKKLVTPTVRVSTKRSRSKSSLRWVWMPAVVAIAASILLVVWYGPFEKRQPKIGPAIAGDFGVAPSGPIQLPKLGKERITELAMDDSSAVEGDDFPSHGFEPAASTLRESKKLRGVPLAADSVPTESSARLPEGLEGSRPLKPALEAKAVRLVSRQVDDEMRAYWQSLQVEPTQDASADAVSTRVAKTLGVEISSEAVLDVERLQDQLSRPGQAVSIATSWLNELTNNGFSRMSDDDRELLLSTFSDVIVSRKGFDRVMAGLIDGRSPASSSWYNAMATHGEAVMPHRIASVTMNTDLRCTRCHDSLIEGKDQQQDHWAFVAMLRSRLRWNDQGRLEVLSRDAAQANRKNFFYDLPDGRRRLVQPAIASQWMGMDTTDSVSDLDQWANDLIGSRPLANGLVTSLWRTLYGRPLVGSSVDVVTSPGQTSLFQIQTDLSDDLIASDFDIARTLALMIHSPAFQRSVPDVLEPRKTLLARRDQVEQANKLVEAFAAAAPSRSPIGINQKLAYVLRSTGLKIDLAEADASIMLSQADDSNSTRRTRNQPQPKFRSTDLPSDFPSDVSRSPALWLDKLGDVDAKVEHLAFLAGRGGVPESVTTAVDAMRRVKTDEALMLQRAWWLLSN